MASPAGLTITADGGRSGLVSSFQRSYGTVKDSTPAISVSGRPGSYFVHTVQEEDTLQGLAVRYGVTVSNQQNILPPSLPLPLPSFTLWSSIELALAKGKGWCSSNVCCVSPASVQTECINTAVVSRYAVICVYVCNLSGQRRQSYAREHFQSQHCSSLV